MFFNPVVDTSEEDENIIEKVMEFKSKKYLVELESKNNAIEEERKFEKGIAVAVGGGLAGGGIAAMAGLISLIPVVGIPLAAATAVGSVALGKSIAKDAENDAAKKFTASEKEFNHECLESLSMIVTFEILRQVSNYKINEIMNRADNDNSDEDDFFDEI